MDASALMWCHSLPASFLGSTILTFISFYLCSCVRSRLRFSSSKIAPALSIAEAQDRVLYSLQEGNSVRAQTQRTAVITLEVLILQIQCVGGFSEVRGKSGTLVKDLADI